MSTLNAHCRNYLLVLVEKKENHLLNAVDRVLQSLLDFQEQDL